MTWCQKYTVEIEDVCLQQIKNWLLHLDQKTSAQIQSWTTDVNNNQLHDSAGAFLFVATEKAFEN